GPPLAGKQRTSVMIQVAPYLAGSKPPQVKRLVPSVARYCVPRGGLLLRSDETFPYPF
ncbi:uncharacterized protein METZ01_LOCUS330180, partial [marine metagenome]